MAGSIFSKYKDSLLDFVDKDNKYNLRFPLARTGSTFNNYLRGDFIVVGGRKTSGKGSFVLNNYVISPIVQKISAKKNDKPFDLKLVYINSKRSLKTVMERMIVNFYSYNKGGSKMGVPSLYGYEGNHVKVKASGAKSVINDAMNKFNAFVEKGYLNVMSSRRTIFEIEAIIRNSMEEYGELDEENDVFTYHEKHLELQTIISIDDAAGIASENGGSSLKTDAGHAIAKKLRQLAKTYNILIVLTVPSSYMYTKAAGHRSSVEEIYPYNIYADRVIILHNPSETDEAVMYGYHTSDFTNQKTGICYIRMAFIAANYMGASGISIPYFIYPENGYFMELPGIDDDDELDVYQKLIY